MNSSSEKFIRILSSFVKEERLGLSGVSSREWEEIYEMAQQHKLELAVYETVYELNSFQEMPEDWKENWKQRVRHITVSEMRKIERFWEIYGELCREGLHPLVVKGVVCRFLYGKPYARPSGDEDLLIRKEEEKLCCQVMEKAGMRKGSPNESMVLIFDDTISGLHLEVHKELFDQSVYSGELFNSWFTEAFQSPVEMEIEGHRIWAMNPTLHMLYLFGHWIKHFIGPGVGVRQICDISQYVNAYGEQVDWKFIWDKVKREHFDVLCGNLLDIGIRYFGLDRTRLKCPEGLLERADSGALLEDLLEAGIYGSSSASRLHSSTITLDAVRGRRGRTRILFPPVQNIQGRYPLLKKMPWLLPAVWIHRLVSYGIEVVKTRRGDNSPAASIAIGNSRVYLLKKYDVLK